MEKSGLKFDSLANPFGDTTKNFDSETPPPKRVKVRFVSGTTILWLDGVVLETYYNEGIEDWVVKVQLAHGEVVDKRAQEVRRVTDG